MSLCGMKGFELLAKPGLRHSFTRASTVPWLSCLYTFKQAQRKAVSMIQDNDRCGTDFFVPWLIKAQMQIIVVFEPLCGSYYATAQTSAKMTGSARQAVSRQQRVPVPCCLAVRSVFGSWTFETALSMCAAP